MMGRRIACLAAALALAAGLAGVAEARSLVYCAEGSPAGFDPALHTDPATLDASSQAIYNRLVQFKPGTTEIVPALAESWDISPDGREYTFRLRPGVKFHTTAGFTPARAFNADDVVFSFERQWREDHPWHDYAGGGGWPWFEGMSLPGVLADIRKVDDLTVTFVLQRPYAPFLADLAMDFASILSREYADRLLSAGTREKLDLAPVGTGPFRLVDYQPGAAVRYQANPDYWRKRAPLDTLTFEITPDSGVRYEKLKSGDCQVIPSPDPADIAAIRADDRLKLLEGRGLALAYLAFNTAEPPFDRARVRRAIARALDKEAIVADVYKGAASAAGGLLPPLMPGGGNVAGAETYDGAAAKQALEAAGAAGTAMRLFVLPAPRPYSPDPGRMAEMIRGDLEAAGIAAEIVSPPAEEFIAATLAPDRKGAVPLGWVSDNGDPDNLLAPLLGCDAVGISNRTFWCNARFDSLLAQARATIDPAARARLYADAQRIVADEAPVIPVAHVAVTSATVAGVTGLVVDPFGRHNFETVDLVGGE
jgi:dipeptide transport system substrate-binding protein